MRKVARQKQDALGGLRGMNQEGFLEEVASQVR